MCKMIVWEALCVVFLNNHIIKVWKNTYRRNIYSYLKQLFKRFKLYFVCKILNIDIYLYINIDMSIYTMWRYLKLFILVADIHVLYKNYFLKTGHISLLHTIYYCLGLISFLAMRSRSDISRFTTFTNMLNWSSDKRLVLLYNWRNWKQFGTQIKIQR